MHLRSTVKSGLLFAMIRADEKRETAVVTIPTLLELPAF